jgi:hypothetical protein
MLSYLQMRKTRASKAMSQQPEGVRGGMLFRAGTNESMRE